MSNGVGVVPTELCSRLVTAGPASSSTDTWFSTISGAVFETLIGTLTKKEADAAIGVAMTHRTEDAETVQVPFSSP
jgi:hypothetical protein